MPWKTSPSIASNARPKAALSAAAPLHPREARFYELDILRGVAAIIVVMFHYKHFLLISDAAGFDYDHLPFHTILLPVYLYGQFFVELFFSISGYVFFWLYGEAVSSHRTGAKSFFIARFARLYPLYFVTLIFVAVAQPVFRYLYGADFIYPHNTLGNFLLNLFVVQQWTINAPQMFNGPAWSISVEMFLYIVFFIVCYFRANTIPILIALFLAGHLYRVSHLMEINDFARGAPNFFLGGLVFYAVRRLRQPDRVTWRRRILTGLAVALPCLWALSYVRGGIVPPAVPQSDILSRLLSIDTFLYVLLPLTLLALGLMQDRWKTPLLGRETLHRWSWIGDISYSIYLLHFPLQLAVMMVLAHWPFAARAMFFGSPLVFLAFFAVAMGLAWLSHRYFEMPVQRFLRGWLTQHLAKPATAG
ncbi:acyltransferase [Asticcacaulis sp.]|uniref:acyltransferase family protein n=1 Tax=Asticcacaulis sp. TaxID=1872648 RepID=UPI002BBBE539|nr:acyltransferase [Asticcacaulis sp.]HTM81023.1 acyltransferase [Asticcacaulis sp.]